jgi:hypothetical protein
MAILSYLVISNKMAAKMNDGFIEATAFRGRILFSASSHIQPDAKVF